MKPLDERQRHEHTQMARYREQMEASWDAIVGGDLEKGLDFLEKAEETLRTAINNKVVPLRGPKGRGT